MRNAAHFIASAVEAAIWRTRHLEEQPLREALERVILSLGVRADLHSIVVADMLTEWARDKLNLRDGFFAGRKTD